MNSSLVQEMSEPQLRWVHDIAAQLRHDYPRMTYRLALTLVLDATPDHSITCPLDLVQWHERAEHDWTSK